MYTTCYLLLEGDALIILSLHNVCPDMSNWKEI